jgi:hypothetical protein
VHICKEMAICPVIRPNLVREFCFVVLAKHISFSRGSRSLRPPVWTRLPMLVPANF